MPQRIDAPTRITAAGNKPKLIDEYVGRVNNREAHISVGANGVRRGSYTEVRIPAGQP
jgi:hypothetical protein